MIKILLSLSLLLASLTIKAQSYLDSLYHTWQDESAADSTRLDAFKTYIWDAYLYSQLDSALLLCEDMIVFGEEKNYPKAIYQAYTLQSIAYNLQGDFDKSMATAQRSIEGNIAIGNKAGISEAEIVVGVVFMDQGLLPEALKHFNNALSIDEEIGNRGGMAMSLTNIANILRGQGEISRALEGYQKALAIDEELGIKQGIAVELTSIADIYLEQGNTTKALEYYKRSLQLNIEIGDTYGLTYDYNRIGIVHEQQGDYSLAMDYYQKQLQLAKELESPQEVANSLNTIGTFYLEQADYQQAITYCQKAYSIAKDIGSIGYQESSCNCLYQAYKKVNNTDKALSFFEQRTALKDSLYNEENTKKLVQIDMQNQFDRKEAIAIAEQEKKDALTKKELQRQKLVRNGFMGGFAVVFLFAGVFFVQRNRIGKEKQRSEELLLNILPEETAQELKEKGESEAKLIEYATVLFTDFKGFTAMSEQLSPKDLVKDLHLCFSLFDQICEKHGIEKIKTIGDAYMAAGGLPTPNHTHAKDVVEAALEMAVVVEEGKANKIAKGLPYFEVRVGIHTGPVVAGIVGVKKFQYDIWGDTVNTASRMESSGEVGRVNISQSTYEVLKSDADFTFESRGKIQAKGKGEIDMYFVNRSFS